MSPCCSKEYYMERKILRVWDTFWNWLWRHLQLSFLVITVITILFSPQIAMMFSDNNDAVFLEEASRAITIVSFSFVINSITCVIKKHTQAVGRRKYASLTNILGNIVFMGMLSLLLVKMLGTDGLFMSYTICYILILITHLTYAKINSLKTKRHGFDILAHECSAVKLFIAETIEFAGVAQLVAHLIGSVCVVVSAKPWKYVVFHVKIIAVRTVLEQLETKKWKLNPLFFCIFLFP